MATRSDTPYYQSLYVGGGIASGSNDGTWLGYRHPDWQKNWLKWVYARDVYTGEVCDPGKIGSYLIRKGTGETLAAYFERLALADFTSHFGVCADALAGMLFHTEDDANRTFGALGDKEDPSSVAGALWRNANGKNTGYATIWKQLGIEFVITHCHWVTVDVVHGSPSIILVEPERVVDWTEDEHGLAEVKVCEAAQVRRGVMSEPEVVEQYVVYTREGWQRYRSVQDKGGKATVVAVGEPGFYRYEDAAGHPSLPIFRVELPLKRNLGYPLAKKNVAIFNKESERDFQLRNGAFAKLFLAADDEMYKKLSKQMADGWFTIQEDPTISKSHRFDAPPTASVETASKVLDQKVEHFWRTFFREYADSAQEKTATEVRQDVSSGVGAFLQMLRAGLDDAENQTLWRLEQAVHPNDRSKWFQAKVERDDNFQPLNIDEEIERLRLRYLGQTTPVPASRAALKEVVRQILVWDGIAPNDKELDAAVDNHILLQTKELFAELPLPPATKAQLTVAWASRLGVQVDVAEAQRIAESEQQSKELLTQPFGLPPGEPGPEKPEPTPSAPEPTKAEPSRGTTRIKRDGEGGYVVERGS